MKNYSTKSTNKLLVSFVLKSLISTALTLFCFGFLVSEIILKMDIDLNDVSYFSFFIVILSSFVVSFISVYSIKNSGALFGALSQIPLVFYMLINAIFHDSNWLFFIIKLVVCMLLGALGGIIASKRSKKFKV